MLDSDIYAKLTAVFHDVFDDDAIKLTSTTTAKDVERWDSLAHVRLIVAVEEAFSIRFAAGESTALKDVGHLVSKIQEKLRK